jgi:hypothetical protein
MEHNVNTNGYAERNSEVMTVKNWLVVMLLSAIPLVNIILLFVWAFGDNVNLNKRNYSRAALLAALIGVVIYAVIMILFFVVFASTMSNMN